MSTTMNVALPTIRSLLAGLAAAALLSIAASARAGADDKQPTWPAEGIEDFTLTEASGRTITKADLLGEPWLASFIFTNCAGPCPLVSQRMEMLQEKTKGLGIRLVSFTVDPDRDTPEVLRAYADYYHADPTRWLFLTGDKATIFRLIRKSFKMIVDDDPKARAGFEVIHSIDILHVDKTGRVVGKYSARDDVAMARLRRVLGKSDAGDAEIIEQEDERQKRQEEIAKAIAMEELEAIEDAAKRASQVEKFESLPAWVQNLPAVNAGLNGLATIMLLAGLGLIKSGRVEAHKATMVSAFITSALFLTCYLVYHWHAGSRSYAGAGVAASVYYIILVSHIVLAIAVAVMAPTTLFLGLTRRWKKHRRLARITFPIWLYVSVTGVIIYVMLYHGPGAVVLP